MNQLQRDEFVQLLQRYELTIATLYETFAVILPSSRDVWLHYAKEEHLHAKWIQELHVHLKDEKISFEQSRATTQSIKISIEYIETQIKKATGAKIGLEQALNIALDIEQSLLESTFLKVFKLRGPKAEKIRSRLFEATQSHIKRLREWKMEIRKV